MENCGIGGDICGRTCDNRNVSFAQLITHLMQLWGSLMQSVLHLNRSHASQPIGGVRASPLSSPLTPPPPSCRRNTAKSSVR